VAITVLGSTLAFAQGNPGLDVQFKLRTGLALGTNDDHVKARTLGFGLQLGYEGDFGRIGAELGLQYKPGDQYRSDVSTFPVAPGMPKPDNASSGDIRRNSVEGVTLRLAYENTLSGAWGWRAGVQLGGAKYRHEYLGDIADAGFATYEDVYAGAITKSVLAVSPFVGVSYRFDKTSAMEFNLVGVSYTAINYVHVAGQGQDAHGYQITKLDYTTENKRIVPHIEIGYSFRF
jgi:hypothetical protein